MLARKFISGVFTFSDSWKIGILQIDTHRGITFGFVSENHCTQDLRRDFSGNQGGRLDFPTLNRKRQKQISSVHRTNSGGQVSKPEFRAMTPRFVVKDFGGAIEHYEKLGFQVKYRDEGFMILGRDTVEIQMNADADQVRGGSICYMTVSAIETIYKEISSKIPLDPCNGRHYSINKQPYGAEEFALHDPFGNLLIFAEPTD